MFEVKKVIPPLAAASLALTGCGDDGGGGSGGAGGDAIEEAVEKFCMKVVECYQDETQQECESYELDYLEGVSDDCLGPWTTYFNCFSELTCGEFYGDYQSCLDEIVDEFGQELFDECSP